MLPTAAQVLAAAHRLRGIVVRTPLVKSEVLSSRAGADVYLKCEQLQETGSFKLRGAYNALSLTSAEARARGVVASSAGNHGLGLSRAAQLLGARVRVFMPASAPTVKRDGIGALGAEIDQSQPHYDEAHHAALEFAEREGLAFINPCAGEDILAGQGSVAVEIIEDLPDAGTILVPFGGGGLIGGIASFTRAISPRTRIVGVQGDRSNAAALSLAAGHRIDVAIEPTLADGLSGQVDDVGFAIGKFAADEMAVVSETDIEGAIRFLWREHEMKVEGSAAVTVAAILGGLSARGPIVAVLSGGNIDEHVWRRVCGLS